MEDRNDRWVVQVICKTYNHASYIIDAMNGFTMQRTSFPFVCTIIDDASTDGEQEIIRRYLLEHFNEEVRREETPDFIKLFVQHKTNSNCYFAVLFLKYNHFRIKKSKQPYLAEWSENAKYIAMCEGDDYWSDANKLEKQVAFLELNIEIGLCYTRARQLRDNLLKEEPILDQCDTVSLIRMNPIRTLTVVFRSILYREYLSFVNRENIKPFDYPLFLWFSFYSKIGYLNDITGVYRVNDESISHSKNNSQKVISFLESCMVARDYWIKLLQLDPTPFWYKHDVKCYKFAIANFDRENILKYRNKIAQYSDVSAIKKSPYVEFVRRTKMDFCISWMYRITKPVFSNFVREHANKW